MIHAERVRVLREGTETGRRYVLYWMQSAQRAAGNPALEYAVGQADMRDLPVLVYFGLTERYPEANLRHYTFLMEGLQEVRRALDERGIGFTVRLGSPPEGAVALAADAALVTMDRGYLKHQQDWYRHVVRHARCPVVQVEGNVVVPVESAYPREAYSAAVLRPAILDHLAHFLKPLQERAPQVAARELLEEDRPDLPALLGRTDIDRTVSPVEGFRGGTKEGMRMLQAFIDTRLPTYAERRNDPATDCASELSPYLHFGQVSPVELARRVRAAGGPGAAEFLEQLVVRRELAMNYAHYNPAYDTVNGLPRWARETLQAHASDRREHLYTREELAEARAHDPYWNAAQTELSTTGRMHGYMRMYWGKKLLEWTSSPAEALRTGLWLNNRYALDGRDPNSYAGVAWCMGKHDRPWKERPIFGKVRYMNAKGLERKFDMGAYLAKVHNT